MKAIIVGGGIGGLTTALMLRARGIDCELYEQTDTIRELGVGINTLPHAIRELAGIGLLDRLDAVAVRTAELFYLTRHGQQVWHEKRGLDAGHDVPQFSIHRGRLQGVIHQAVIERLGDDAIRTGCRLGAFSQDEGGVTAYFFDRSGAHVHTARGDILIGATPEFWEYPCCDRDPLPYWSSGRVTLLGDAAHPMYPVGSNGASQAILDARCLADALARSEHPRQALAAYEKQRLPMTADIVASNRRGGPEGVIDAVEQLAPQGFSDIDTILNYEAREAIVRGYAAKAGFAARVVSR